jgi:hypothetical protein
MPPDLRVDPDQIHQMANKIHDEFAATQARPFPWVPFLLYTPDNQMLLHDTIYDVLEDFRNGGRTLGHAIDQFVCDLKKYADEMRLNDQEAANGLAALEFHGDGSTPGGFR